VIDCVFCFLFIILLKNLVLGFVNFFAVIQWFNIRKLMHILKGEFHTNM